MYAEIRTFDEIGDDWIYNIAEADSVTACIRYAKKISRQELAGQRVKINVMNPNCIESIEYKSRIIVTDIIIGKGATL